MRTGKGRVEGRAIGPSRERDFTTDFANGVLLRRGANIRLDGIGRADKTEGPLIDKGEPIGKRVELDASTGSK